MSARTTTRRVPLPPESAPIDFVGVKTLYPKRPGEFAGWLACHARRATEVWFVFYKKTSGRKTVSYQHALHEVLCYGWIDSRAKTLDAERLSVWFTPRRPGSPWSKRDLVFAEALLHSGRMTDAGVAVLPARLRRKAYHKGK